MLKKLRSASLDWQLQLPTSKLSVQSPSSLSVAVTEGRHAIAVVLVSVLCLAEAAAARMTTRTCGGKRTASGQAVPRDGSEDRERAITLLHGGRRPQLEGVDIFCCGFGEGDDVPRRTP